MGLDLGKVTRQLCDAAFHGVVQDLLEGYIVIGGTATGQVGHVAGQGGVDFVWDLWNEQFSAFTYPTGGVNTDSLIGAAAMGHVGFGTGRFSDIHAAWSGEFRSVEVGFEIKAWRVLGINGAVQYFQSPDGAMKGALGLLGGSASIPNSVKKIFKFPANASVTAGTGFWTPADQLTQQFTPGDRRRDLKSAGGHRYLDLEEGILGVGSHMLHVMGVSPGTLALAGYAVAVSLAKAHGEAKGITDRAQALRDLHLTLCSLAYRQISQYKSDVPSGTSSKDYDGVQVQRTNRGKFIITSTTKTATGEWRTARRLHDGDGKVLAQHNYWVAMGGAPNGFIDRRSYPMSRFSDEINRRLKDYMNR